VRFALVPVVGIALQHHAVAGRPRLDDERAGADRIAVVVVALAWIAVGDCIELFWSGRVSIAGWFTDGSRRLKTTVRSSLASTLRKFEM